MKLIYGGIFIFFGLMSEAFAQSHQPNEWWPLGKRDTIGDTNYGNAWLHFVGDSVEISTTDLDMSFEASVAVASDTMGKVLFYSNGCEIRNALGNIIPNGDQINPGALHDWICADGYVMPRSMTTLQKPNSADHWYMFHIGGRYDPVRKMIYEKLYYTEVAISSLTATGEVLSKNVLLLEGDLEPFSAVRHGNGRDWWLIIPQYNSNRYYKWLISPLGILSQGFQEVGDSLGCKKIGGSVFSADGSLYARTNNCGAVVCHFDRCSGLFSNPIFMERPGGDYGDGGLAFSDNNRWLYATSNLCIFRADLTSDTPFLDSLYKRPYIYEESQYVYGTSLTYMQPTPSGKILMSARHQEKYFSTFDIELDTFALGVKGFKLPVNTIRTLPYFPNYRLLDIANSPCDTLGINTPTSIENPNNGEGSTKCYPNPFSNKITFEISINEPTVLILYDAAGRNVSTTKLSNGKNTLDWGELSNGIYFYHLISEKKGNRVTLGKVVKLRI